MVRERRRALETVAIGGLVVLGLLMSLPIEAGAYEVRGYDPDDRTAIGADPDIRSTILRVDRGKTGRSLVLVVRAFEDYGVWWGMVVRLDAQDGQRLTDHVLSLWNWDISAEPGQGCSVWDAGRSSDARLGTFRQNGKAVRCRLPIRLIQPDHQIDWRIVSRSSYDEGDLERAPDTGWYG